MLRTDAGLGRTGHRFACGSQFAYDRKSSIGQFDKGLDEAQAQGWIIVDMKDDWKTIYLTDQK